MKKFFNKFNISLIILIIISILCFVLSTFSPYFVYVSLVCLSVVFIMLARKFRKIYKAQLEVDENDYIFDATKFGYDEEVYALPGAKKSSVKNNFFSKFNAMTPYVVFLILSIMLVAITVGMIVVEILR